MEPFVHDTQYSILICTLCKYAVVANEVTAHLHNHYQSITAKARSKVARLVSDIPSIIRSQADLQSFQYPDSTVKPIAHIAPPQVDRLHCYSCRYICRCVQNMQEHCRVEHGWQNDWQKGGNVQKRAIAARDLLWAMGVLCQQFFPSHAGSWWFEVGRGLGMAVQSEPAVPAASKTRWFVALHENQEKRFEADACEEVSTVDEKLEPNGWLYHVGWTRDLEGLNKMQLQEAMQPIEDGEETLQNVWAVFNSVANKARATAAPHKVRHNILFEAERKEISQKPVQPFNNRIEDDTWEQYKEVWRKIVSIWFRMDESPERERPPYQFTIQQGSL
ncbi:hypothetical protein CKAH01_18891 [Colletotrichum kahawae]|uniref:Uncharacterized protein n=1 Tax=Colletotrichum kahawae TaxID=34407 RepID=A0AAD9Y547_COLKA|nr:hypothetical protein CKAH01_18891 [Colletotrichum kahawae]